MPVEMIVLLVLYFLLWQGYQLRRRVSRFARVALFVHIALSLLNSGQARLADAGFYGDLDPRVMTFLVGMVLLVAATIGLYLFRLAVDGYTPTSRRSVLTVLTGAAVVVAMLWLTLSAQADGLPIAGGAEAYGHVRGAIAFTLIGFYLGGARALVVVWMFRRSREASRDLRLGIRVAAIGLVASGGISVVRAIPPFVVLLGGPLISTPSFLLAMAPIIATPLQLGGMSYPLVAGRVRAVAAWRRNRRAFARIEPLWTLAQDAFPQVVLPNGDRRRPLSYRLRRRRAECLDALHLLRGDGTAARNEDAADELRTAVAGFERSRPDGERLWTLVDEHRATSDTDPTPDEPRDHELLDQLSRIVRERRATATSAV
ncbi:MAB_1171c family putative transporter [Pseudonocardia endophytica]|uniref:DUF6545 domain-containing protein n=1 Tax=Pseudonocardia endophytica TaxID=401976 RepID=A0A4R1HPL0_PSEEN|nr:MAB_1171c family putative transporter [Pseudonocardia endophytica]TCK22350.1 hypothetical protein EV378_6352 [Pseudonocardia endophytica]